MTTLRLRLFRLSLPVALCVLATAPAQATDSAENLQKMYEAEQAKLKAKTAPKRKPEPERQIRPAPAEDSSHEAPGKSHEVESSARVIEPEMVSLPIGIRMGKYEVTQGQWRSVMGGNPSHFSSCGDDCPVEEVSWNDVQDYIQRLNARTGKHYRLPTEDEWFRACQAGSTTEYCGSNSIDSVAWYDGNSGGRTHPVGQKQPNAWGLYDMSGNVWEWPQACVGWFCGRFHQMIRGGSWGNGPGDARASGRYVTAADPNNGVDPTVRDESIGFRLAQD